MSECRFDFFLSFTGADRELADSVYAILTCPIDGKPRYKVCYQPVNFPVADDFLDDMRAALIDSNKVLVLLTPKYLSGSVYTLSEFKSAFKRGKLLIFRFENATVPEYASFVIHHAFKTSEGDIGFEEEVLSAARLQPTPTHMMAKRFGKITMPRWKGSLEGRLIGRDAELEMLTDAYHDKNCRIVLIVAAGGFGKSSLVTQWLENIQRQNFLDADVGCFYSFTAQGSGGRASVDPCLRYCLESMAGQDIVNENETTVDMVKRLASLLNSQRSLFILDGLETQQAGNSSRNEEGTIEDPAFRDFLTSQLTLNANGLCVITTRKMPPELKGARTGLGAVKVIELKELNADGSKQAFIDGGIAPDHEDLEIWVKHSGGHPLLIALLAPAISEGRFDPSTFAAHRILDDEGNADYAETINSFVGSYLPTLGEAARALLSAICVFEDAISIRELARLLKKPIPGFNADLFKNKGVIRAPELNESVVIDSIKRLRRASLISVSGPPDWRSSVLHVHPIVQAGIRTDLKKLQPKQWKVANRIVYHTRLRLVKEVQPSNKKELLEIYAAIPHGVEAGRALTAGWIYARRCLRYFRGYSTNNHGMIGDDVALISHYFERGWQTLRHDLKLNRYAEVQAYVWAGVLLCGVNRSIDGCPLMVEGLTRAVSTKNFTTAARVARFLGTQYAMNGDLEQGETQLRDSVSYLSQQRPISTRILEAKIVNLHFHTMATHTLLGSVLHYRGKNDEAEEAFQEAEARLRAVSRFKGLRGIWCFRKSEFLIDNCRFDEADTLIEAAMKDPEEPKGWGEGIFAMPVLQLALIRSRIRRADMHGEQKGWSEVQTLAAAFKEFEADQRLRMDWLIPMFKVATSGVARISGSPEAALSPLHEAERWVARSANRLFASDIHLERSRVHQAIGNHFEAAEQLAIAATRANELGYRARAMEIDRLRAANA